MIRHISVFTFKDSSPDGRSKAENIETVRAYLETVPARYPAMVRQHIAVQKAHTPDLPEDAPVMFGDLVQEADFATIEDADGYPASAAHTELAEFSTPMLRKVTAIDYEI